MGINCISLAVWLGEDRKWFCGCGRFGFDVRIILGEGRRRKESAAEIEPIFWPVQKLSESGKKAPRLIR